MLDALRAEVAELRQRVALLEGKLPAAAHTRESPVPASSEEIDAETLAAISAALAAYLGVTPRIRQVRLLRGTSWAQQGRVTIQASHTLSSWHDQ
jgi:methylmalonyl-CoA carboxyltransferase large subunit